MKYRLAMRKAEQQLLDAGIEEAANDAWLLLEHVCGLSRTAYFMKMTEEMEPEQEQAYFAAVDRRAERIPLQHITGTAWFMGLPFHVSPDVLCPRPDTEVLVEEAMKYAGEGMRILDMCTGSGCILISLLRLCPGTTGCGADLSEKALDIARENAAANQVEAEFIQSDLFTDIHGRFDMIVSNPPYIPSAVIPTLMPEVRFYDPMMALDGKEDGLYFYREITHLSRQYLTDNGKLIFEIGHDQGEDVAELLRQEGFANVRVIQDLARNDRVVIGESNV